jgi:spermidine/putrescine transport system ATP-binding protein
MIDRSDGTTPGPPEIRLTDLTKHFRDVRAVDRVSMDIRSGEFFSMLGPSGCGKTTTLRMIGGFELPTAGRIELRGRDVTTDPPDKRPVNMVFQNYALFPHLDVHENIAFGLRRKGVERSDTRRRVGEALDLVHLGGYDRRKPNQLSGGQQQRVALARALVNRPNVLLLDEPLGALDLKLRKALQIELKRVQTEVGITFVYVTHDQEEALTMSDRIAVMRGGRVEQLGTPEELYERPRTRFVADFIGTSNLLSGTVEAIHGPNAVVRLSSGETCLTTAAAGITVGRSVELSVRPETVVLDARNGSGPSDQPGSIPAAVEQVAYLGGNVQYLVRSGGGLSITALASKAGPRIPVGGAVDVTWSPGDALVLAEHPAAQEEIPA